MRGKERGARSEKRSDEQRNVRVIVVSNKVVLTPVAALACRFARATA